MLNSSSLVRIHQLEETSILRHGLVELLPADLPEPAIETEEWHVVHQLIHILYTVPSEGTDEACIELEDSLEVAGAVRRISALQDESGTRRVVLVYQSKEHLHEWLRGVAEE